MQQDANCHVTGCKLSCDRMQTVMRQDANCYATGCKLSCDRMQTVMRQDANCYATGCRMLCKLLCDRMQDVMQTVMRQDAGCYATTKMSCNRRKISTRSILIEDRCAGCDSGAHNHCYDYVLCNPLYSPLPLS
jgi:hypothetical protein